MKTRTKREKLKLKLLKSGYSEESIKKLFQGRQKPPLDKAFSLHDNFNVNINIWRDIKSYLQENNTKQSNTIATPQGQNNGTR